MILAAGLSPAWQQIMVFDAVQPGEVNRAAEVHWCASGKVLNVGQTLSRLNAEQLTLSLLGGPTGQAIEREFAEQEIACRWVWTKRPTRVCTTIVERSPDRITELVENAAPITPTELDNFRDAFREAAAAAQVVVLTGSLPTGAPPTLFRELTESASAAVILDLRGPELRHALECRPLVVKPNRAELVATFGRPLTRDEDLIAAMRELNRLGAVWVLVSHGGNAAWLSSADAVYRFPLPPIQVINPIGSGDCLAAGLALGISEGRDMVDAVRYGLAAATENARQLLPARLDQQAVLQQAQALNVERRSLTL